MILAFSLVSLANLIVRKAERCRNEQESSEVNSASSGWLEIYPETTPAAQQALVTDALGAILRTSD